MKYSSLQQPIKEKNSRVGGGSDLQSYHNIIVKCSLFAKNIPRHTKKQDVITHSRGKKNKWTETVSEEVHTLEL